MTICLFQPMTIKDVTLKNRIVATPMCQYSAIDGATSEWHFSHYAGLARGGASLVIVEATGVSPEGRITPGCTGLLNDGQIGGLASIASSIKSADAVPGIQLGHAGRKASLSRPWEGDRHLVGPGSGGWETLAPSALAYGYNLPIVPKAMSLEEIARVQSDFVAATRRAREAGFEWLELHFAHGFLAQTFFSDRTNLREDPYGRDAAGRSRFLLETVSAVRDAWPDSLPLTVRFGCVEFDGHDEERAEAVIELVRRFQGLGVDLLDVSMGFTDHNESIPWGPGMLAPVSATIRQRTGMPTSISWNVESPQLAERIIAEGQADLICIGKALLANPHHPFVMARALGMERPSWLLPAPYAHWLERYAPLA